MGRSISEESIEALQQAIERLHNCKARYKEKVHITERLKGKIVWDGDVYLFDLKKHHSAKLAYAWLAPVKDSNKTRFYVILHAPPVKSAQDALRVAILNQGFSAINEKVS